MNWFFLFRRKSGPKAIIKPISKENSAQGTLEAVNDPDRVVIKLYKRYLKYNLKPSSPFSRDEHPFIDFSVLDGATQLLKSLPAESDQFWLRAAQGSQFEQNPQDSSISISS